MKKISLVTLVCALWGCVEVPDLGPAAVAATGEPPALVPADQILGKADSLGAAPARDDLAGRLAALNARAAALRGPILTASETARLAQDPAS